MNSSIRIGDGRAREKRAANGALVAGDTALQNRVPTIGAVHVPSVERTSSHREMMKRQRVIAGAAKMPVVAAAFLLA